jgi:hypothetical protein
MLGRGTNVKTYGITASAMATAFLLFAPTLALAASPHLIGNQTLTKNTDFSLSLQFKAAGLANIVTRAFLSSSDVSGILQCVNPAGHNPPPKAFDFGPLTGPAQDIPPSNGQITATVSIGPPPLPSPADFCPAGANTHWTITITSLTYHDVTLHMEQNGVSVGGDFPKNYGDITLPPFGSVSVDP